MGRFGEHERSFWYVTIAKNERAAADNVARENVVDATDTVFVAESMDRSVSLGSMARPTPVLGSRHAPSTD